jgi:hypothetical protein
MISQHGQYNKYHVFCCTVTNSAVCFELYLYLFRKASPRPRAPLKPMTFFVNFFGGLECVGHSFAYVAHYVFLRDVWIRTYVESCCGKQARYQLSFRTHLPKKQLSAFRSLAAVRKSSVLHKFAV